MCPQGTPFFSNLLCHKREAARFFSLWASTILFFVLGLMSLVTRSFFAGCSPDSSASLDSFQRFARVYALPICEHRKLTLCTFYKHGNSFITWQHHQKTFPVRWKLALARMHVMNASVLALLGSPLHRALHQVGDLVEPSPTSHHL